MATVRRDAEDAVRAALAGAPTLHAWAAAQPDHEVFSGRGATYGVQLGGLRAVVRHAHRGGTFGPLLGDRYLGRPRFETEMAMSARLLAAGVATPAVLAGLRYDAGLWHRSDVATERFDGHDLAAIFFEAEAPDAARREAIWAAVGALVKRLHSAGYVHRDLQLKNVLVGADDAACLLDVDTCRAARGAGDLASNLKRFERSWVSWNDAGSEQLTEADRVAFLAAYRSAA